MKNFYDLANLIGVVVFAWSGTLKASRSQANPLIMVIFTFFATFGGGLFRDLILLNVTPGVLTNYYEVMLAILICLFYLNTLCGSPLDEKLRDRKASAIVDALDGLGLGSFIVFGVKKAMLLQAHPAIVVLSGTLTGFGGGIIASLFYECSVKEGNCTKPLSMRLGQTLRANVPYRLATFVASITYFSMCSASIPNDVAVNSMIVMTAITFLAVSENIRNIVAARILAVLRHRIPAEGMLLWAPILVLIGIIEDRYRRRAVKYSFQAFSSKNYKHIRLIAWD